MDSYDQIVNINIEEEMKTSYIDYAMSVIVSRALPDVRDGLKPVHRRILYAMSELNLEPSKKYRKSARIVGDTMGKYHPHGESSIYDSMVRMAQDFSTRYLLVDGHGNFGSIDGDDAAAQRYTEAKLTKISMEMLRDIDKDTIVFRPNFDESEKEPEYLPSRFPNLLANGSVGIAVGMATNITPHNLNELIDALLKIIDNSIHENRETDIEEIITIVKGPDFPTGGIILGKSGIRQAFRTGRGKIKLRSRCHIEELPNGMERIIVTEIPYQTNKSKLIEKIAELVKEKKVEGISYLTDDSNRDGIRIVMDLKRDANSGVVLNQLYKNSQLQDTFSINMIALVDNEPRQLNLKQLLDYYLDHQKDIETKKTKFELKKAENRSHILEGLKIALDHIDEIIEIIRSSKDNSESKERLMERFGFTEIQVHAVLEMKIRALSGLDRSRVENEWIQLAETISRLKAILSDEHLLFQIIREDLVEIKRKYGDARRTEIIVDPGEIDLEDLIDEEINVITMTKMDYIKRLPLATYRSQNRGGKGIIGMQTREEDFVNRMILSSTHDFVLFFTNHGKVYKIKAYEIPEVGRAAKGIPIVNLMKLDPNEKITAMIPVKDFENGFLFMTTSRGIIKKTPIKYYLNIRKAGLRAIELKENDNLVSVVLTSGEDKIFVATRNGQGIVFDEKNVRSMGRVTMGVMGIRLRKDDVVLSADLIHPEEKILIVSEKGYGKLLKSADLKIQHRGGKGVKIHNITEKTGKLAAFKTVYENEHVMIATSEGTVIRIRINEISTMGRVTQGVKLMNVDPQASISCIATVEEDMTEEEINDNKENV